MFSPVNRYILIDIPKIQEGDAESLIVLPEDYKPKEERFIEVSAITAATDVRFAVPHSARLIVDRSMVEEISVGGTIYNVVLDNYVIGMLS